MKDTLLTCCILSLLFSCHAQNANRNIAVTPDAIYASKKIPLQETPDSRESICNAGEQEFEIRFASPQHPIYSFSFKVLFNQTVLHFREAVGGDFLGKIEKDSHNIKEGEGGGRVVFFAHPEKEGRINVGLSLLGQVPGKKGEGRLAILCFAIEPHTSSEFRIRDIRLTKSLTSSLLYSNVVETGGGISFLSRRVSAPQFSEGLSF